MVNEGPYIFYKNDSVLNVNYIDGSRKEGYSLEQQDYPIDSLVSATCYNSLDSTSFHFPIRTDFRSTPIRYNDENPILAISDIEGNYMAFRNFLMNSDVIDENLNWIFGKGHLVLVGDFVDRGVFVTQVLWLIYKLEQDAEKQGGQVHFIIGNHELKAMQGNTMSASPKYFRIETILGKNQVEFYNSNSLIGRWLSSKNSVEIINGHLFVHGGIHADLAQSNLSLEEINDVIKANYYKPYFPKPVENLDQLILSTSTGPCWYRGYYKDDLTQEQIDGSLDRLKAKAVVVGHTIQGKVNRRYNGRVIGIDVKHPSDDHKNWPKGKSEGLLIRGDKYYRVDVNGVLDEI